MAAGDLRAGYIELIRQLGELRPTVYVFGGYAEDALLWGKTMRDHSDVDIMVRRPELTERMQQFRDLGFDHFDTYYELVPGKPQVLNGERDGLHLEVSVLEPDGNRGYFLVEAGDKRFRMYIEAHAFDHPPCEIEGVPVQTISPLMLYRIREGLQITGAFGELRPHDHERQRALKEKFFPNAAEEELRTEIVEARD